MKIIRAIASVACVLLLAGCLPVTTKTPVGTTAGLGVDEALYGTWRGPAEDGKGIAYLHILKSEKDKTMAGILVEGDLKGQGDGGAILVQFDTARLGQNRYLNVRHLLDDDKDKEGDMSWTDINGASAPFLYRLEGDRLTLLWLDEDKVKAAIKSGVLTGTIGDGDYGDVQITLDAKALDAFMAKPEATKLFKVYLTLTRAD